MNVQTVLDRALAGLASALHPQTIGRFLLTEARGVQRVYTSWHGFVNATDRPELRETNPTKHEEVTARRRFIAWTFTVVWFGVAIFSWRYGIVGKFLFSWFHVCVFFYLGYAERVMTPVKTSRIAGESFIRKIFDDVTLSPSKVKEGFTTTIVTPPVRLSQNNGYEVTVRVSGEGDASKAFSPAGLGALAQKMHKDTRTVFTKTVPGDSSLVRMIVLDSDPWSAPPTQNPLVVSPREINLWTHVCDMGVFEDSAPWLVRLAEEGDGGGWIVGGAPRRGKTVFLSNLITYILLDPSANLHLIDGKAVDFAPVKNVATTYIADPSISDLELLRLATEHVENQQVEINRRRKLLFGKYAKLSATVAAELNLSTEWTVIDELAVITEDLVKTNKSEVEHFLTVLQSNIKMGPAFGVFAILASQRPSSGVIPVGIRDLIIRRTAFYISGVSGSQAIMGKAGPEYRADWLDPDQKGVSITVAVGQTRCHLVGLDELERVARYAATIRSKPVDTGVAPKSYPEPVAAVLSAFNEAQEDVLSTAEIVDHIRSTTGKQLNPQTLAKSLKAFGVSPGRPYRNGVQVRGYTRSQFNRVQPRETSAERPRLAPVSETE